MYADFGMIGFATSTKGSATLATFNGQTFIIASTTGGYNTGLGIGTQANTTNGVANTSLGYSALTANTAGGNNVAIGYLSMNANTTGPNNVSVGQSSLLHNTGGSANTALGDSTLNSLDGTESAAYGNTAAGAFSLFSLTTGIVNTALGDNAGFSQISGDANIAIGNDVDLPNLTGSNQLNIGNVVYGSGMYDGFPGNYSSAPVTNAKFAVSSSSPFAQFAIHAVDGSTNKTLFAIGSSTASATTTILVVTNAGTVGLSTTSPWGELSIEMNTSNPSFVVSNQGSTTPSFYIGGVNQNGVIGIGTTTTSTTTPLQVQSSSAVNGLAVASFTNNSGTCFISPTNTGLSCSSDIRLKKNINTLASSSLDAIHLLRAVTYNWNSEATGTPTHTGFIAQEVEAILPDIVSTDMFGMKSVNYAGLTPYLASAIQEMNLKLDTIASTTASSTPESQSFATSFYANIFARMTTWLASAGNGIADLFATTIHAKTLYADKLCLGATCVTESQLQALLVGQTAQAASPSSPAPTDSGSSTSPVLSESSDISASSTPSTTTSNSDTATSTPVVTVSEPIPVPDVPVGDGSSTPTTQ
jgi:hypothetical protein